MSPSVEVLDLHLQSRIDSADLCDCVAPCLRALSLFGGRDTHPQAVARALCTMPTRQLELYTSHLSFTSEIRDMLSEARPFQTLEKCKISCGWATLSTSDVFFLLTLMPHATSVEIRDTSLPGFFGRHDPPWYVSDAASLDIPAFQLRSYDINYPFVGWHIPIMCSANTLRSLDVISNFSKPEELVALTAVAATLEQLVFSPGTLPDHVIPGLAACKRLRYLGIYIKEGLTGPRMLAMFDAFVLARCRMKTLSFIPLHGDNIEPMSAIVHWRLLDLCQALRTLRQLSFLSEPAPFPTGPHDTSVLRAALQVLNSYCASRKVRFYGGQYS